MYKVMKDILNRFDRGLPVKDLSRCGKRSSAGTRNIVTVRPLPLALGKVNPKDIAMFLPPTK